MAPRYDILRRLCPGCFGQREPDDYHWPGRQICFVFYDNNYTGSLTLQACSHRGNQYRSPQFLSAENYGILYNLDSSSQGDSSEKAWGQSEALQ